MSRKKLANFQIFYNNLLMLKVIKKIIVQVEYSGVNMWYVGFQTATTCSSEGANWGL